MLSKALPKSFAFTHAVMLSTQEKKNIPSDVLVSLEMQVDVWDNKKCCGNRSRWVTVSTAFSSSPKLT